MGAPAGGRGTLAHCPSATRAAAHRREDGEAPVVAGFSSPRYSRS
jgi:hypothetical protein